MKRGFLKALSLILALSVVPFNFAFAQEELEQRINLTFDSDIFIKPSTKNIGKSYFDEKLYYDGEKYPSEMTIGDMTYSIDGDMDSKKNDALSVENADVTIPINNNAVKQIGLIMVSREASASDKVKIKVNYETGVSQEYSADLYNMETASDKADDGQNPIEVIKKSAISYLPTVDTNKTVYLNSTVIDLSESLYKNVKAQSVTLSAKDYKYYVIAASQINFSQSEINEQSKELIRETYGKYIDLNYLELYNGENGTTIDGAKELQSALLAQLGNMPEATQENINKINMLAEGAELYKEIYGYKTEIENSEKKYLDISSDFDDLSNTELTDSDFTELERLLGLYYSYEKANIERLDELTQYYELTDKVGYKVNTENKSKLQLLYNAYKKAMLKDELKIKIEKLYGNYIDKDISEITEKDENDLKELVSYFDEADKNEIVFNEYKADYIRHLLNDYKKYIGSENTIPTDISKYYNVDMIANPGETADVNTWYESSDNLRGDKFTTKGSYHWGISNYDSATNVLTMAEYEYVRTEITDPNTEITSVKYPFTKTGKNIDFIIPQNGLTAGKLDAMLVKSGTSKGVTIDLSGGFGEKIYLLASFANVAELKPIVNYTDGTSDEISVRAHSAGQVVNEIRNQRNTYPDTAANITSGDYKDYNMAKTGVIYAPDENTTNGFVVYSIKTNSEKQLKSVTLNGTSVNYTVIGISEKPVSNSVITERVNELYDEVVTGGNNDIQKVSDLVLNYNEAINRGLYFEKIDKSVMEQLSGKVLTAKISASRYDKDTVKAKAEFSVPVTKESAEENITAKLDGTAADGVTVTVSGDGMSADIEIPVTRKGIDKLTVTADSQISIEKYPDIKMLNKCETELSIPTYITAEMNENSVTVTNNSQTAQKYLIYITSEKDGKAVNVSKLNGNIGAGETKTEMFMAVQGTQQSAAVLDADTFEPLYEITEAAVTASAADRTADYRQPELMLENDSVKICGFTPSKAENKIVVLDIESASQTPLYIGETAANSDGYFEFNIPLNTVLINASGYLNITLGGDDFAQPYKNSDVYFPISGDRTDIVNALRNAPDENSMEQLLETAQKALSLNFTPFAELMKNSQTKSKLAKRVYDIRSSIPSIADSDSETAKREAVSAAQKLIKRQAVITAMELGKNELFSGDTGLLYNDVMGYSSIDKNGVNLYDIYQNDLSSDGTADVTKDLSGKNYSDIDGVYSELAKSIMLDAIKYPKYTTVSRVKKVLTKANADIVKIDISKYLNLTDTSSADSHIANMNLSSLKDITDYISTLSSGTSGGSVSGRGGGGGNVPTSPIWNQKELEEGNTKNDGFNDLPQNHWAYNAVYELKQKGIINGKDKNSFKPNDRLTRAEFVKMLCLAKNINGGSDAEFSDVSENAWYAPYVKAAYTAGIVNGISQTEFGADIPISRQDICVVLYRLDGEPQAEKASFSDADTIADYAQNAVAYFGSKKIVNGFENNLFKPLEYATRAQAAVIIYNYLNAE